MTPPVLRSQDYLDLPALIPFRGDWDQWAKKNEYLHRPETESVCFLFSFMKGWEGDTPFLKIDLTDDQQRFIDSLIQYCRVRTDHYEEEWFWKTMTERGSGNPYRYQLNFHPELILCGMAQEKDFPLFSVADHQQYLSGIFKTRIRNMELRIRCLSFFLSLYPRLHHSMVSGSILD